MNKLKFLLFTFSAIVLMVGIYSCAKDTDRSENKELANQQLESRASGSACSPEDISNIFTGCYHQLRDIPINFSPGYTLYSSGSTLYQLCPGIQLNVSYTFSTCNIGGNGVIHFVHNLTYNLADLLAACPALQAELNNQQALGNLIGFLDLLDSDISKQVEFT